MVEASQPGELPLMRELSSLKRVRSLRDPSTGSNMIGGSSSIRTPSWKSPLLEVKADQSSTMAESREVKDGLSSVYAGQASTRRDLPSPYSDPIHAAAGRDLGMESEEPSSINFHMKRKPAAHMLQQKPILNRCHGRPFLRPTWRDPGWASDIEATHASSYSSQDRIVIRPRKSFDFPVNGGPGSHSQAAVAALRNGVSGERMRNAKQHTRVHSPLVLNSLDDTGRHPANSLPVFCLGERHLERHGQPSINLAATNSTATRGFSKAGRTRHSSQSSHFSKLSISRSQKEAAKSSWKAQQHMLASSTSTSQRTLSQSSVSGAWELTSNQLPDELDVCELPKNRCGIPCYWSKSQKRGKSLLDIGLHSKSPKPMMHSGSQLYIPGSEEELHGYPGHEPPLPPLDLEALPLLSDPSAASVCSSIEDSDKVSSDLDGELGLDGGTSVPECTAQLSVTEGKELAIYCERPRSLSQKYRPKAFEELIGQNFVGQALSSAVQKRKIAPVYLFQGSRGTGKTSAARIFAAALNCLSLQDQRPCGVCKECLAFATGKCLDIREVDAASNNAVAKVRSLLQTAFSSPSTSRYKVFIIDECHMLTNETWNALLKLLQKPSRNVVFILITTDPDKLPDVAVSRCQKFGFAKIKELEIVERLQVLAKLENLVVEPGTLELVASRSDGSLRDAEIILDQLCLLGQKITVSMVHELFGSVSDEKLLGLLDAALTSDTVNTVQRARQLIDSGVEPLDLMVQVATLITKILAGSNDVLTKNNGGFFPNHGLSEEELERLRYALQVLSDAEKQLRASMTDRTTWLTAALLQLGPARACAVSVATSCTSASASPVMKASVSSRQVLKVINGKSHTSDARGLSLAGSQKKGHSLTITKGKSRSGKACFDVQVHPEEASNVSIGSLREHSNAEAQIYDLPVSNERRATLVGPGNLESIWWNVLEICKSPAVRQLLQNHGKLVAVSIATDGAVVFLELDHPEHKSKSERCRRSIANCFREVLGIAVVDVNIGISRVATTSMGARVQAIVDARAPQWKGQDSNFSSAAVRQPQEEKVMGGGSLHYWRSRSQTTSPCTIPEQAHPAHSSPEVLTISRHKAAVLDQASSLNGTYHVGSGIQTFQKVGVPLAAEVSSFGGSKARVVPSLQRPQCGDGVQESMWDHGASMRKSAPAFRTQGGIAVPKVGFSYELEAENLRLESQSKYGGLLCWRRPQVEDQEVLKQDRKRCGVLMRLVPCGLSQRR